MADRRGVAVAFFPHHVEHLAPISAAMQVPMVVCDSPGQVAAVAAYPDIEAVFVRGLRIPDGVERVLACLDDLDAGVIYYSDLIPRATLRGYFRGRPAPPRIVHCPHGFSEKRQPWARQVAYQDVALLLGQHALDQLRAMGVAQCESTVVVTGHYRRRYFDQHRAFFARQCAAWGVAPDDPRRTVLYAPTWDDRIGSTSLFTALSTLLERVPADTRLIVKLHPHLEKKAPAVTGLLSRSAGRDDVVILRNCPLVFPFLECADIYVGDMSALAYDFLACNKPMFFLNQPAGTAHDASRTLLFQCGTPIAPRAYADTWRIIADALPRDAERFGARRAALDAYTHAPALDAAALRAAITQAVAGDAPRWMCAPEADPATDERVSAR